MKILIVEKEQDLGCLWQRHMVRQGADVDLVNSQDQAIDCLTEETYDIIILDLVLESGSALAVSDFACYRCPETRVIFVTNTSFFSDGSIFAYSLNACAFVPSNTPPEDLTAMAEHYAGAL